VNEHSVKLAQVPTIELLVEQVREGLRASPQKAACRIQ